MNKEPIQMTPGDDLHLTLLMAPQSLNFVTGQDREHLLAFGRAAFDAGQSSKCLHQIAEPSAQTPEDAQIQALMRKHRIWIEHSTLFENDEPERELRAVQAEEHQFNAFVQDLIAATQLATAPQAVQPVVPLPLLVRDIARDLGITVPEACIALKPLGYYSTNSVVTAEMATKLREAFPNPAPQAVQAAVPDGWQLVPMNATAEMLNALMSEGEADAANEIAPELRQTLQQRAGIAARYTAVLAVAPAHPVEGLPAPVAAGEHEDMQDMVSKALTTAWQLGQTFWRQADSVRHTMHAKSEQTERDFEALIENTRAALAATQPTEAARSVLAERARQIAAEGWTPEKDDAYNPGVLAEAGGIYALHAFDPRRVKETPEGWPWSPGWWKPKDPRTNLVKAGALVLAEIERIDRTYAAQAKQGGAA